MSGVRGGWAPAGSDVEGLQQSDARLMVPPVAYRTAYESIGELQNSLQGYDQQVAKVIQHINTLASVVDSLQQHYDSVVEEKEYIIRSLDVAEGRMQDVQRIVQRYAAVTDPVVASDGFTYERDVITNYFNECQAQKNIPMSQQTHTELTMMLFPNRSFKRFLEQLMETKPAEMRAEASSSSHGNHGGNANASSRSAGNAQNTHKADVSNKSGNTGANGERLHPCVRVYGYCNYKDACAYALYPYDACLSHLKGKCRFRSQCHERHVDFHGPRNHGPANGG
ncbi:putative RNA-binding protein [Trypanosoma cruzi]|uniref:RNA-binding protein, putative n=2 Tax=Trypanosoma cruzi TaxID=5693 RepID=Q4DCC7_TRYCC|nr:RNA-binding protein, putative [Trypanosoma cruzi]EAN90179.1 RNA-binding protein, putative [Trypanosoma cruzi]PWV17419.1 putative RNA-binding protein [Trypanosoma cruzi]RNC47574.1 RNA-binding protein [Trypanosoma cruzi]|eukprot:XP_812030.1 RNA-binding protein [Trypanosoma cruzi strain CL Brener]